MSETLLQLPDQWLKIPRFEKYHLIDPDGWKRGTKEEFDEDWNTPISKDDMLLKLTRCCLEIDIPA